jgi:hypothetical protein
MKTVGPKYEATKTLDLAEIAKLVRADIKEAVRQRALPPAKYTVRIERYSMGQSVNVSVSNVEKPGFVLANEHRVRWDLENPYAGLCGAPEAAFFLYSFDAREILRAIEEEIVFAYNYKQSDSYNCRFHASVTFESEWSSELLEKHRTAIRNEKTSKPANDTTNTQELYLASMGAL